MVTRRLFFRHCSYAWRPQTGKQKAGLHLQEAQPAGGAPPPKTEAQFRTEIEEMAAVVSQASGTVDALIEALPEMPPESELDEQLRQAHAESEALEAELVKALGDAEDKLQRAREVYQRGTAHVEKKPRAPDEE